MGNLRAIAGVVFIGVLALAARGQVPIGPDGWTQFTPSPDSRLIHVSTSGSDSNSGLSPTTPKRTIAAGASLMRNGYPDWLLLRSGDTFSEVFPSWTKGGRSANEPMRIGVYGGVARATLLCGTSRGISAFVSGSTPRSHLALTDICFIASGYNGSNSTAAGVEFLGSWTNVLLENVEIRGFVVNLIFQSNRTIEVMRDMRVRRSVIVDAYATTGANAEGCYIAGVDKLLLEECVFDHNGWNESVPGATANIFRHNIYIQGHNGQYDDCTNVTTRGLISARAAATGMQQRPGGICENSLFLDNPLNLVFGTTGGTVRDCVVIGSHDIAPGIQRGVGYNLVQGTEPRRAVNCISVGLPAPMGTANVYAYAIDTAPNTTLENCVSWRWKSAAGSGQPVHATNSPMPTVIGGNMEQKAPEWPVTVEGYLQSLGVSGGGLAQFMSECRKQSRALWRTQYTADGFNDWARAAFGMASSCYANCDGSTSAPLLNIGDMTCFMTLYAAGDPRANCDASAPAPAINMADFSCFLQKFAAGCP